MLGDLFELGAKLLPGAPEVVGQSVAVTSNDLITDFEDGRRISLPLAWYPRLLQAKPAERNNWGLVGNGEGVHWPDLDEDVSAENLILGQPARESQASFARWLRSRQTADERSGRRPAAAELESKCGELGRVRPQ